MVVCSRTIQSYPLGGDKTTDGAGRPSPRPARLRRAGRPAQRAAAAGNRPPAYRLMQGM